jgi:hypothetical protein
LLAHSAVSIHVSRYRSTRPRAELDATRDTDSGIAHINIKLLLPTSKHTADGLLPYLATYLGLNTLVLLLRNLFTHLPITGIAAQNIRVEDGDGTKSNSHRLSEEILKCPRYAAHKDVECEAPNGIEEETKVHGNHNAEEFQLRFQDADQ